LKKNGGKDNMNISQVLEFALVVTSLLVTFFVTLGYLVRFQRKIDRLLITISLIVNRLKDLEDYMEKHTDFQTKKSIKEFTLPELNTDFI
jgi:hypothetical protein